ncbi:MAG: efflux RND transporter periplasmic adaptor subunit [Planctomycetes bacterium]|nr:efflux RND transporter periplasmic adaptor subunit [Planctomycetota bacterium]
MAAIVGLVLAGTAGSSSRAAVHDPQEPVRLVGLTVASHLAAIAAEQSGTIVEMQAKEGDEIDVGDVLFQLSSRLQQLEVDRLQALVDSDLEHEKASASLDHAKKRAERVGALMQKEISAESAALEVELESELARLSLGKVEFERTLLQNELMQAREKLAQRTLRSPLKGTVTRRFKQQGETADQLEPVVEVMSLNPLLVQFECPVARENMFPLGGVVRVRPTIGEHEPRLATIVHVSLQAAVAGHTFSIRASLPNDDPMWRAGLKMEVESVAPTQAKPPGGK